MASKLHTQNIDIQAVKYLVNFLAYSKENSFHRILWDHAIDPNSKGFPKVFCTEIQGFCTQKCKNPGCQCKNF